MYLRSVQLDVMPELLEQLMHAFMHNPDATFLPRLKVGWQAKNIPKATARVWVVAINGEQQSQQDKRAVRAARIQRSI